MNYSSAERRGPTLKGTGGPCIVPDQPHLLRGRSTVDRPMPQNVVILGSTGSIGENTLDVLSHLGPEYRVLGLSATASPPIGGAVAAHRPQTVVLSGHEVPPETDSDGLAKSLRELGIGVEFGAEALIRLATLPAAGAWWCRPWSAPPGWSPRSRR